MKKPVRILLLSSSTGGHAIPLFEVYQELQKHGEVLPRIVHSGSKIEEELFPANFSYLLKSGKVNRYQPFKNLSEIIKLFFAMWRSLYILIAFRPKIIFSKGGFNSVPVLFWAKIMNIPYFLHESDSEMGAANNSFYKKSVKTFVSFPISNYRQDADKLLYSGMIVRSFKEITKHHYERPMILITGGSQGAIAINKTVFAILPKLLDKYMLIHHVGLNDEENAKKEAAKIPDELSRYYQYFVFSTEKMMRAIEEADLVISRAGSTIGEIAKLSKASILIPYPYAAADHQMKNAKYLEKVGGAIIIKQDILTPEMLLERIDFIMSDKRNSEVLGRNANRAIKTDGKKFVVDEILKFVRKR